MDMQPFAETQQFFVKQRCAPHTPVVACWRVPVPWQQTLAVTPPLGKGPADLTAC